MNDTNCPYCDAEIGINHDDGYGYDENAIYNQQCNKCGKYFVFTISFSISYDTSKADCLNGAEHIFNPTETFPRMFTRMECSTCGETRKPTDEEMKEIIKKDKTNG